MAKRSEEFICPFEMDGRTYNGSFAIAHNEPADILNGGDVLEPEPTLRLRFDYPLSREVEIASEKPGGNWTRAEFAAAVVKGYRHIYGEEQASRSRDPGRVPGMLNRARSDGEYGIWGHDIGDLFLEGARRGEDGVWELGMGS